MKPDPTDKTAPPTATSHGAPTAAAEGREETSLVIQPGPNVETLPFPVVVPAHTGPMEPAAESVAAQIQPLARGRSWAGRPRVVGPSD
jgi:hypothetical protein